jgi:hypothetical protein
MEARNMTDISMRTHDDRSRAADDMGATAIGGTTLVGIGVGLAFLPAAPLLFVTSVLTGIGVGLLISSWRSGRGR